MKKQKRKRPRAAAPFWKSLPADKVLRGAVACAKALDMPLISVRGLTSEQLDDAITPWWMFAKLTLSVGAFDYPVNDDPTVAQVMHVMLDFLRCTGEATASDDLKIRTAMIGRLPPHLAEALNKKCGYAL